MAKLSTALSVALTASAATTPVIAYDGYSVGGINVPTGSGLTSLTYHGCQTIDGTFVPLQDAAASPAAVVQTVAAAKGYPIPDSVRGWRFLKIVGNTTGSIGLSMKEL